MDDGTDGWMDGSCEKASRKYASISLLKIGMNIIMPTFEGWEGNHAYL
jgi:hypothetical protein